MSDLRFCPQCGSAAVNFSALTGGRSSCRGCSWVGPALDLLVVPLSKEGSFDAEAHLAAIMNDVRKLFSGELGLPYLRFLVKWGFVPADTSNIAGTIDRKLFARYLAEMAAAVVRAVLETREKIELERIGTSS